MVHSSIVGIFPAPLAQVEQQREGVTAVLDNEGRVAASVTSVDSVPAALPCGILLGQDVELQVKKEQEDEDEEWEEGDEEDGVELDGEKGNFFCSQCKT